MSDAALNVAIIGGGIAGLAAASVLRRKHRVTVFERNPQGVPESGATVGIGPNGSRMAASLGLTREQLGGVFCNGIQTYDQNESLLTESKLNYAEVFDSEW
jgi:salicylate hydroxylase